MFGLRFYLNGFISGFMRVRTNFPVQNCIFVPVNTIRVKSSNKGYLH
jgi:hypothetical protein